MAKKRVIRQTVIQDPEDIFGGMGHFVPRPTIQMVKVKPPTKTQVKKTIQRLIDKIDPPREVIPVAKKAAKPKAPPKPKKGKSVAKTTEVEIKSPVTGKTQWMPMVAELSELLAEGWVIVDGDVPVNQAYEFLKFTPEEV